MFESAAMLREAGFQGFHTIGELFASKLQAVPKLPGVYVVIRESRRPPMFLSVSTAGHHKGRDPSYSLESLEEAWIADACVMYIGKAGGAGTDTHLRKRLSAYLRHGHGRSAGHSGGRSIWHLPDAAALFVAWKVVLDAEPSDIESQLIEEHRRQYGARPFANRRD